MICVYVAGLYSGNGVMEVLSNIGRGEDTVAELMKAGFAPYNPWADRHIVYRLKNEIEVEQYKKASFAWVPRADAVFLTEGWEKSRGAKREADIAMRLHIPVFTSLEAMKAYFKLKQN